MWGIRGRIVAANAAVALVYWVAGLFGLSLAQLHPSASAIWPPTGIAIAAIFLLGARVAPGVLLGALAVNMASGPWALLIAAGNTGEGLLGGLLLRHWVGQAEFQEPTGLARFAGVVGLAAAVSATAGVAALVLSGSLGLAGASAVWSTWWLGNLMGGLVVTPAIILAARPVPPPRTLEAAGWSLLAVAVAALLFLPTWTSAVPLAFVLLPPLILLAVRSGPTVASWASLAVGGVAILGTLRGTGPFAGLSANLALVILASFIAVLSLSALLVASESHRRRVRESELARARDSLEEAVVQRTQSLQKAVDALQAEATERRRAADNAAHHRRLLGVAQRIGRVGSWEWDIRADAISWSDELYRIYGYGEARPPIDFPSFMERIHPEDRERVQQTVGQAMESHQPFSFDHRIVRLDGQVRTLHGEGIVELEDGKPARMYGTGQDITERRETEEAQRRAEEAHNEVERLRELSEMKSAFLNMAAHELSTPLTPLQIQLHLMKNRPRDPEDAKAVATMARNVQRLGELVKDLLETARIQSGRVVLEKEPTDIPQLVEDVRSMLAPQAEDGGIDLAVQVQATTAIVDPGKLRHVIMNLLSNALKFTPEGGHVRLEVDQGSDLVIRVEDDGIGVAPSMLERLFEPFVRVHDTDQVRAPGTGLGLSICKGLVEAHGGSIKVTSDGPGKGTRFTVTLPLRERGSRPRGRRPPLKATAR